MPRSSLLVLLACVVTALVTRYAILENTPETPPEKLHATLWVQTSVEYAMACEQAFLLGKIQLSKGLRNRNWTALLEQSSGYKDLPPAVILDLDETVLDNSPFQARLVEDYEQYDKQSWDCWVRERKAKLLPGARAFLDFAVSQGFTLFFVTNRDFETEAATVANLRAELGMDITAEQVLCRHERADWGSDKSSRRARVAATHRVVLLFGDDYNDFAFLGEISAAERARQAISHKNYWGTKWIVLPNPLYGNWERALYGYAFDLTDPERIGQMRDALETSESDE